MDIRRGAVFDEQSKASELLCFMLGNLGLALKGETGDSLGLQRCLLGLPLPLSLLGEALQFTLLGLLRLVQHCFSLIGTTRDQSVTSVRRSDPDSPPRRRPPREPQGPR